jgi:glycerol-3-phosphate dehydrogenase (NAD(P)+)
MTSTSNVAVLGGGSWATAIAKLLLQNDQQINWYFRKKDTIDFIKKNGHNPRYLSTIAFDTKKIQFYNSPTEAIEKAKIVVFAIPSIYLKSHLDGKALNLKEKFVISAIKGIIPNEKLTVGAFFKKHYKVPESLFGVITGPSHAEEIAMERLTYLTIATQNTDQGSIIADKLSTEYVKTILTTDIIGVEYAAVLKNIVAIASGICHGLGYGDNFQAVLVANAFKEIERFLQAAFPKKARQIKNSAYLGDLLVTTYSNFSRNRNLGLMIGKGYTVKSALLEMNMVAEGYYATDCIYHINQQQNVDMPILEAVYQVLYKQGVAKNVVKELSEKLH